jgi:hypothetical protein
LKGVKIKNREAKGKKMAEIILPKNSRVVKGSEFIQEGCSKDKAIKVQVYRYDPDKALQPRLDTFYLRQDKNNSKY